MMQIRWMIRRDMPQVLAIERRVYLDPWTERDFIAAIQQQDHIGMVAEIGELPAGFMVYAMRKKHIEIVNLAVDPAYQRQGIGSRMVARIIGKPSRNRREIQANVRERNLAAQLFLREIGFRAERIIPGDCYGWDEDAYEMVCRLQQDAELSV